MKIAKKLFFPSLILFVLFAVIVYISAFQLPHIENKYLPPEQFEIVNGTPYCVKDGTLYHYEDGSWLTVELSGQIRQLVGGGSALCTVNMNGKVSYGGNLTVAHSNTLTSAHYFNMAEALIELSELTPLAKLSDNLTSGPNALAVDGTIFLPVVDHYERYTMEEQVTILSNKFILTEKGNVYILRVINFDEPHLHCIYNGGDITLISAYSTGQCLGIKKDGTVLSWNESSYKNFDIPFVSCWEDIATVKQGFHFAVGLTKKGEVLYADSDEENTKKFDKKLKEWGKVENIAIYGMTVYGLKTDGTCLSMEINL